MTSTSTAAASSKTKEFFYRLAGDVDGNQAVDAADLASISAALSKTGTGLAADVNGDNSVDGTDSYLANRSKTALKGLKSGLRIDG